MDKPFIFRHEASDKEGQFRCVDRLTVHQGPTTFSSLIPQLIPSDADFVVFDLDNTFHLQRNVGEMLGWDIVGREGWGERFYQLIADQDRPSRMVLDPSDIPGIARYLLNGAKTWALPGMIYGLWMKLIYGNRKLRRLAFLYFGAEPVKAVQQIPQGALLHQMSRYSLGQLRYWTKVLLHRIADDMVITPADIEQIREHAPNARLVISSASPQPVLEAAADYFGIDDVIYSEIETLDELISSPPLLHWFFNRDETPDRIAPLQSLQINNSHAKVRKLAERYPQFSTANTVGISDTDKGEDHAWSTLFRHLIDVNSNDPFPPIVDMDSPTETIDSVHLLSQYEQRQRRDDPEFLDPRRKFRPPEQTCSFSQQELNERLHSHVEEANALQKEGYTVRARIRDAIDTAWGETRSAMEAFNDAVEAYNKSEQQGRDQQLTTLQNAWSTFQDAQRHLARLQRPFADKYRALQNLLHDARAALDPAHTEPL
jgi:hypothetical protein